MKTFRIGSGYDSHRFEEGRPLVLGGVLFPGEKGLAGHSDADVLIHAVIDSLLGAVAAGDIGEKFPDTDERFKGADSAMLLSSVVESLSRDGWSVGNVDVTLIAERPRIRPYVARIRSSLAGLLGVDVESVSVKGKTNEKMDDVGSLVGMACHAVALVFKNSKEDQK